VFYKTQLHSFTHINANKIWIENASPTTSLNTTNPSNKPDSLFRRPFVRLYQQESAKIARFPLQPDSSNT